MCGIAGGTGADGADRRTTLDAQLATLARRGPDSRGFLPGPGAMVGQTRLSVIDVVHSDPPLTDESGQIRVALNGEIYNYRRLREQLRQNGHRLATEGDTEVLAHLAEDLDPVELARRLEGMFAFAIWDARRERLVLGRDRMGKKPLYWWSDGADLVFGSEIKAVLADPRVPRRLDPAAVPQYLLHGYVPTPGTFFEGIRSVLPGTVLVWERGQATTHRYWSVDLDLPTDRGSFADHAVQARRLLDTAVRERLVADVPLGAFLSGGLDSTAIVGLMAQATGSPVRTFCVGFEDPRYDEREPARLAARTFGTDHTEIVVRPVATDLLDDLLTAFDQPFADSSALPTYLLCRETRQHVTVALSGDGGDEVFAGYQRFAVALALARAGRLSGPAVAGVRRLVAALPGGGDLRSPAARARRLVDQVGVPMPEAYDALVRVFGSAQVETLTGAPAPAPPLPWPTSGDSPLLQRLLDRNRRTYLLDDLLVKVDRMSMAHGLEVRSPFLDHRLVEFAARLPSSHHVRGTTLKRLLRAAVADLVPDELLRRPKRGFGVPVDGWFRGELAGEARGMAEPTSRLAPHVDTRVVAQLVAEHESGRAAHGPRLWSLLLLERFLERESW